MTGLAVAGVVVLTAIVAYFTIGWVLAKRDLPHAWERARDTYCMDDTVRSSVKEQTVCLTLFWPVLIPARKISRRLTVVVTYGDPAELKRQLEEREQHIARLERELGINN